MTNDAHTPVPESTDIDAALVDASLNHTSGLVIEAMGSGNMGAEMGAGVARALQAGVPVVISTRTPYGVTKLAYGGAGGGATLGEMGAVAPVDSAQAKPVSCSLRPWPRVLRWARCLVRSLLPRPIPRASCPLVVAPLPPPRGQRLHPAGCLPRPMSPADRRGGGLHPQPRRSARNPGL